MIQLPNFPMRSQLHDVKSADGSSPNAAYDCVPTSLAACVQYFDHKVVAADDILDMVYHEGYKGGTNELNFAGVMRDKFALALTFEPHASGTTQITDAIRSYLKRGIPCIITMQSDWNALWGHARFPGLHVGVAYAISETDNGTLSIMNPWLGASHVRPVREWAARLGIGVWPVAKIGAPAPDPLHGYKWDASAGTLTAPNDIVMIGGMAAKKRADILAGVDQAGYPRGPEFRVALAEGDTAVETFGSDTWIWRDGFSGAQYASKADTAQIIDRLARQCGLVK